MGAGMWRELVGSWTYSAGTNGTLSLPRGAVVLAIRAEGAGTIKIFDRPVYTFGAGFVREFNHTLVEAVLVEGLDIVFTGTTSYYVEYLKGPGT